VCLAIFSAIDRRLAFSLMLPQDWRGSGGSSGAVPGKTGPNVEGIRVPNSHSNELKRYWRANQRLIALLLGIWGAVSFGTSILFVEYLNQLSLFGVPFGFWLAQQGSIYVFVLLIFVYASVMDRLDRDFHAND
jgi:putative solute:sodium symporter small subunit